jgi:hypothetical protein
VEGRGHGGGHVRLGCRRGCPYLWVVLLYSEIGGPKPKVGWTCVYGNGIG